MGDRSREKGSRNGERGQEGRNDTNGKKDPGGETWGI